MENEGDSKFNPMRIEEFLDVENCERLGNLRLYELAKSKFKQQNMVAWRPVPTWCYSVSIFVIISLLCFILGAILLSNVLC